MVRDVDTGTTCTTEMATKGHTQSEKFLLAHVVFDTMANTTGDIPELEVNSRVEKLIST